LWYPVFMSKPDDHLMQIDDWCREQDDKPLRSEAIRRLVEIGLKAKGSRCLWWGFASRGWSDDPSALHHGDARAMTVRVLFPGVAGLTGAFWRRSAV
jgi:hypothetical protein